MDENVQFDTVVSVLRSLDTDNIRYDKVIARAKKHYDNCKAAEKLYMYERGSINGQKYFQRQSEYAEQFYMTALSFNSDRFNEAKNYVELLKDFLKDIDDRTDMNLKHKQRIRQFINMYVFRDLKQKQIAEKLGVSKYTIIRLKAEAYSLFDDFVSQRKGDRNAICTTA